MNADDSAQGTGVTEWFDETRNCESLPVFFTATAPPAQLMFLSGMLNRALHRLSKLQMSAYIVDEFCLFVRVSDKKHWKSGSSLVVV